MDFKLIGSYIGAGLKVGAKFATKFGCTAGGLILGVKAGEFISRSADEETGTVITFAAGATGAMFGSALGDGLIAVAEAVATPDEEDDDDATVDVSVNITVEDDDADDDDEGEGFDPYCSDCPYRDEDETTSDEKDGDTEDVGATFPDESEVVEGTVPEEQSIEPNESATADEGVLPSVPTEGTDVTEPVADPPVDEDSADSAATEVDPAEEFVEAAVLDPDGAVEDLLGKQNIIEQHLRKKQHRNADAHKGDRKYDKFN